MTFMPPCHWTITIRCAIGKPLLAAGIVDRIYDLS
jgi:hypothetical protein